MELLAPAGTYEAFLAAVENGADAVYLGGKSFSARANASNFSIEELQQILTYAHLRGVKIHLTMNTLLDDSELPEAFAFAKEAYQLGVDAIIVQDLGLATMLHQAFPDLPLHASTQISAHSLEGVEMLAKLGFSRVVLARELSLDEIRFICEHTTTEIEIFAHGALCVSYSGQCLMSSMIGDRSGNRGKCAQPCRMPYQLIQNQDVVASGYLLSPKDLSTLDILSELPQVTCLKIEGRMKSPEYVATVVQLYRNYLDLAGAAPSQEDQNRLAQVFNRGGFSHAYLHQKTGKDMMCYEKPKHWGCYLGTVASYDGKRYITLAKEANAPELSIGDGIEIWNRTNFSPSTIVSEIIGNQIGRIQGDISVGDKVYKTMDKRLQQSAKETYSRGFRRQTPISITVHIAEGKPISVQLEDFSYSSSLIPEEAQKQPLTVDTVKEHFSKLGNTPFSAKDITVQLEGHVFLPIRQLNELRRQAIEAYEQYILSAYQRPLSPITWESWKKNAFANCSENAETPSKDGNRKHVSVMLRTVQEEFLTLQGVDAFYIPFQEALTKLPQIKQLPGKIYLVLPTITKGNYAALIQKHLANMLTVCDGVVLSHIGQYAYVKDLPTEKIANYTFNTFNTVTLELLASLGFSKALLSPELTKSQMQAIASHTPLPVEVIAYGSLCVMTSEYCPVGSLVGGFSAHHKCSQPCLRGDRYYLRDRMKMDFRILPDAIDCQASIFNSKITSVATKDLAIDSIAIFLLDEPPSSVQSIIDTHKNGERFSGEAYTNGHWNRPV